MKSLIPIELPGTPTTSLQAAHKQYVDDLAASTPALGLFRALMATRDSGPRPIVFVGSSTTAGNNATAPDRRYVNILTALLQDDYPLRGGGASPAMRTLSEAVAAGPLTAGVQGVNAGVGGTTAATYMSSVTRAQIGDLNPSIIIHMVGSNDFISGIAPAVYKANLNNNINALDAEITGPRVHVLVHAYERLDGGGAPYEWAEYGQAIEEIADANPNTRLFVNLDTSYISAGVPGTDPLNLIDTDNFHQTDSGHAVMAILLRSALRGEALPSLTETVDTTAPSAPAGLAATPGNTQVVLSWSAATDASGISGYRVYRGGALIASVSGLSYTSHNLTNGTSYSFQVAAVDAAGNVSPLSGAVSSTPTGPAPLVEDFFTRGNSTTTMGSAPIGGAWGAAGSSGTWGIIDNRAYNTSASSVTSLIEAGQNNVDLRGIVNFGSGGTIPGLTVRALGETNRIGANLNFADQSVVLFLVDNGSANVAATVNMPIVYGVDYLMRITAIGSVITVYIDGELIIQHTLSAGNVTKYTGAGYTKVGLRGSTQSRFDNFVCYAA